MHTCDANTDTSHAGSYVACTHPALFEITLDQSVIARPPAHEYACNRSHLALIAASIATYGLCDFSIRALEPRAYGPEAA